VANVGSGSGTAGWDVPEEEWLRVFQQNLFGAASIARAAIPALVRSARPSITLVASIAGVEAIRAPVPYSAAKAAVVSMGKALSWELGPRGIRMNVVAPGNVLFPGGTWDRKLNERRESIEEYVRQEVPLARFGRPEEIADTIVFLASERSRFTTGACVVVDGGQTRGH
jgi:3-oxoacyl-[acyl-carrier protein] reductase